MKQTLIAILALVMTGLPANAADIVEVLRSSGQFTMLMRATEAAGLQAKLKEPGPFTIFAPHDAAFAALPPEFIESLMKPENKQKLGATLSYHIVAGVVTSSQALGAVDEKVKKASVTMLNNQPVTLSSMGGALMANEAKITNPDLSADNGVIQVVDKVLVPATPLQPNTKQSSTR